MTQPHFAENMIDLKNRLREENKEIYNFDNFGPQSYNPIRSRAEAIQELEDVLQPQIYPDINDIKSFEIPESKQITEYKLKYSRWIPDMKVAQNDSYLNYNQIWNKNDLDFRIFADR